MRCKTVSLIGCWLLAASITCLSGVSVSPDIAYHFGGGPGEGLAVSPDGRFIMVSSPVDVSAQYGLAEESVYASTISHLVHTPKSRNPFMLTHELPLAGGESTDVGVVPGNAWGLAVVRGDTLSPESMLLAIRGNQILQTLPIPKKPDGMKLSPDGQYAIVAVEKGAEIRIYDISGGAGQVRLAALVTKAMLEAFYPEGVPNKAGKLEPEAVGISYDSSFALVSIQEASSIAGISLDAVTLSQAVGATPEEAGDLALINVIHLPYGYIGKDGKKYGPEPDGISISPDGSFAMVAHEANANIKHLQSCSVIDLRQGLENMTAAVYSVFDLDPTLLAGSGLTALPEVAPGDPYPADADNLPRLDPASMKIVERSGQYVAAFVIERYDATAIQKGNGNTENRGSILFLNADQAVDGVLPVIQRVPVGQSKARLEIVEGVDHGRWIFVSISNGGAGGRATFARLELLED